MVFQKGQSMNKGKQNPMYGKPAWNKGKPWSKEMKQKLSIIHKKSSKCKKWLKKLHEQSKGKHRSPKTEFKKGQRSAAWKGGKTKHSEGYIWIFSPKHPFRDSKNYVLEHRLVMEKKLGRYLTPKEVIHHKGTKYPIKSYRNRGDNRPVNLKLFSNTSKHIKFHRLSSPKFGPLPKIMT